MKRTVSSLEDLVNQLGSIRLNEAMSKFEEQYPRPGTARQAVAGMEEIQAQLEQIMAKLHVSEGRHRESEDRVANLATELQKFQTVKTPSSFEDVKTKVASADQIQLDSYKVIPVFSGEQKQYRSWREQVMRRMELIKPHAGHPKYEAALAIIRAKITDGASDILINNNTAYNIEAIINRLDFSYADQRPLYVVEADMTSVRQQNKTLQEYYDAVNQALNMVITKIVMTYKSDEEQKSLIAEINQKAVRTFIIGLKSTTTRHILYGQAPKTLSDAFAVAQTVFYDNQYLHLDQNNDMRKGQSSPKSQPNFNPNFNYNNRPQAQPAKFQPNFAPNFNDNNKQQRPFQPKPEPMEVDSSGRFKQNTNWRQQNMQPNQMNGAQKRDFNSSRQNIQPHKFQRINQLQDDEPSPHDGYEGDIMGSIPDDLISNNFFSNESQHSDTASAFLGE